MSPILQDALLVSTVTLPAGATTTNGNGINLNNNSAAGEFSAAGAGDFCPSMEGELLINAPALTATQLPNTDTITYNVMSSQNANLSSPTTVVAGILVQTGASSAGAAAAQARYRPPTNAQQYFFLQAVGSASGVAASNASATMGLVF